MQITFRCPRCEQTSRCQLPRAATQFACRHCGGTIDVPRDAVEVPGDALDGGNIKLCLACRSPDLFVRKDFPQRLGVMLVVIGFIASSVAWYYYRPILAFACLFALAGIDVVLYLFMGEALVCYRCGAHHRNVANLDQHGSFDLETHERYRQIAARRTDRDADRSSVATGKT